MLEQIKELTGQLLTTIEQYANENSVPPYHPLGDRVLVFPMTEDYMSKKSASGGIFLPGENKPWNSMVIAAGPKADPAIEEGNLVIHGKFIGEIVEIGRIEFRLIKSGDVLAKFTETSEE